MGSPLISLRLQFSLEVFVVLYRLKTNKLTKMRRLNVKEGRKMSWVVPKAPDQQKFSITSSYLLTKPAKTESKKSHKDAQNVFGQLAKSVK
jgi:hypothetical protein